jgi:hypothetical protein
MNWPTDLEPLDEVIRLIEDNGPARQLGYNEVRRLIREIRVLHLALEIAAKNVELYWDALESLSTADSVKRFEGTAKECECGWRFPQDLGMLCDFDGDAKGVNLVGIHLTIGCPACKRVHEIDSQLPQKENDHHGKAEDVN